MDLIDVFRACFRRWYVLLPVLFLTAWTAYSYYHSVRPVYYSSAVVGIAPPNSSISFRGDGVPIEKNGLLDVGGPTLLMNLAVLAYNDPNVRGQVIAGGGFTYFIVKMFPSPITGNGAGEQLPLILIEATDANGASAQKSVELATAQAEAVLTNLQRQAQVPDDLMVHALVASPPTGPIGGVPSRTKSTLYIGLIGTGTAMLLSVIVDVLITRWRTGRRQKTSAGTEGRQVEPQAGRQRPRPETPTASLRPGPDAVDNSPPSTWFEDTYGPPIVNR